MYVRTMSAIYPSSVFSSADSSISNQLSSIPKCLLPDHSSPLHSQISLYKIFSHLYIDCLEASSVAKEGGADEGADGGGKQRDVGVYVGSNN